MKIQDVTTTYETDCPICEEQTIRVETNDHYESVAFAVADCGCTLTPAQIAAVEERVTQELDEAARGW